MFDFVFQLYVPRCVLLIIQCLLPLHMTTAASRPRGRRDEHHTVTSNEQHFIIAFRDLERVSV